MLFAPITSASAIAPFVLPVPVSSHQATFFSRSAKATPAVWCGQAGAWEPQLNRIVGFKFPEGEQQRLGAAVIFFLRASGAVGKRRMASARLFSAARCLRP